jgi:hypothetical protein
MYGTIVTDGFDKPDKYKDLRSRSLGEIQRLAAYAKNLCLDGWSGEPTYCRL